MKDVHRGTSQASQIPAKDVGPSQSLFPPFVRRLQPNHWQPAHCLIASLMEPTHPPVAPPTIEKGWRRDLYNCKLKSAMTVIVTGRGLGAPLLHESMWSAQASIGRSQACNSELVEKAMGDMSE